MGESWENNLNALKAHTAITFNLDELKQFGVDYPGLFNRRIKSVSVTLPMLIGPYEDICAKLSLSGVSSYTTKADLKTVEKMLKEGIRAETPYMVRSIQPNQQIALSTGINDSGMFTLNFDDERFLPFEGVGVGSSWNFQFTNTSQDLESLTDIILHIRYTAQEGSASFGLAVKELLKKENPDL
ncbi:Tc toxin subunit A-related protein [Photorhabdus bodei]|uniref:Tc toxin subunit A-related protein n=1 Tax=Photorhabdus bodei TaxID=2029681 RepID=UPI001E2CD7E8|nr:hypothetical protein [Photorhabdus bodei]MCC8466287.1 hypothetical protein [Photorhabdus bodei]